MATLHALERLKGRIMMFDALYNYRQGDIHAAEFPDEFNKLCIPFENSLRVRSRLMCFTRYSTA